MEDVNQISVYVDSAATPPRVENGVGRIHIDFPLGTDAAFAVSLSEEHAHHLLLALSEKLPAINLTARPAAVTQPIPRDQTQTYRTVWVLRIDHEYGANTYVSNTFDGIKRYLYLYVENWWSDHFDEDVLIPEDHLEAIDRYFEELTEEHYHIEELLLQEETHQQTAPATRNQPTQGFLLKVDDGEVHYGTCAFSLEPLFQRLESHIAVFWSQHFPGINYPVDANHHDRVDDYFTRRRIQNPTVSYSIDSVEFLSSP